MTRTMHPSFLANNQSRSDDPVMWTGSSLYPQQPGRALRANVTAEQRKLVKSKTPVMDWLKKPLW